MTSAARTPTTSHVIIPQPESQRAIYAGEKDGPAAFGAPILSSPLGASSTTPGLITLRLPGDNRRNPDLQSPIPEFIILNKVVEREERHDAWE